MLQLPAGLIWEGTLHRDVEIGPITGAVRREVLSAQGKRSEAHRLHRKILKRVLVKLGSLSPILDEHISALPFCDAEYILFTVANELRGDKPFHTDGFCTECRAKNTCQVQWDEIVIRPIEQTKFSQDRRLKFRLPVGVKNPRTGHIGKTGYLKLYTLADFENLVRSQSATLRSQDDFDPGRLEAGLILSMLDSIEGFTKEEDGEFTIEDLDNMDLRDYETLANAMRDEEPGVILPRPACTSCGAEVRLSVDWVGDFLLRMR